MPQYSRRNDSTRIDVFEELGHVALASLRSFCRRLGAPHLLDEVLLPTLQDGDAQLYAAVRDRPWPPWGLGARHVSALCEVHAVSDESYAISPVYVTDDDVTNVGLSTAVYKEVLEALATSPRAEVNYLVADWSTLAHHVLTYNGFTRHDDVFLTEQSRYFTYRIGAAELLKRLGLTDIATADLLAHDIPNDILERNALFHQTLLLGSRAELFLVDRASEIIGLVRGGHAGKPGGVPSGTGRFGYPVETPDWFFVTLEKFLGDDRAKLLEHVMSKEKSFRAGTVLDHGDDVPVVNEKMRRSKTLDDLGGFEKLIKERIRESLAPALERMKYPSFPVGDIELQVVTSGDGDYFRMHRDSGEGSTREITFVYFFYHEPRRFYGGELRIFDNLPVDGKSVPTDRSQLLSPRQDVAVFFPSRNEHEVLPVRVPSQAFGDGRFTVTGWVHRAK